MTPSLSPTGLRSLGSCFGSLPAQTRTLRPWCSRPATQLRIRDSRTAWISTAFKKWQRFVHCPGRIVADRRDHLHM